MSKLLDDIIKEMYRLRSRGARELKLVVGREVAVQLKRESQEHVRHVVDPDDPQPNTCFGMPFEKSNDIDGWEIHYEARKERLTCLTA